MAMEKAEEVEKVEIEENVFKLTILVPVIQYLEIFTQSQHNQSPDEFVKAIYAPEKPETMPHLDAPCDYNPFALDSTEKLSQELKIPEAPLQKPIAKLFFEIIRFRNFLTNVVSEFSKRQKHRHRPFNVSQTIVITYVLIYRSSSASTNDATNCLIYFDVAKMLSLLSFLLTNKLQTRFYIAGCDLFDVDFVEQKILHPFINAVPVLQAIFSNLLETKRPKPVAKKVTVPLRMNVLKHAKRVPHAPACTPEGVSKMLIQPVPKTLYEMPKIFSKIAALRLENRAQAAQKLEVANSRAPVCFGTKKSKRYQRVLEEIARPKINNHCSRTAGKIPPFKNVSVKKTITTILREEAVIANSEVKEVEKLVVKQATECEQLLKSLLQELMKGSFNPSEVQKVEEEIRQREKEADLRRIEEKHLSGLISYEESLLAKRQLIKEAQEQGNRVRSEREELVAKLEKYRLEQTEKFKRIVEKSHEADEAVKNAYNSMVDVKRLKAAEVAEESRRIRLLLLEQKQEELKKKLDIIREIKSFQTSRGSRVKEFDPKETSNLGLMCEMSLAELKDKLSIAKEKWRDELINRKEEIKNRRKKQEDLIDSAQKSIDAYRLSKQSLTPSVCLISDNSKILNTPELEALRQKLKERRMNRLQKIN